MAPYVAFDHASQRVKLASDEPIDYRQRVEDFGPELDGVIDDAMWGVTEGSVSEDDDPDRFWQEVYERVLAEGDARGYLSMKLASEDRLGSVQQEQSKLDYFGETPKRLAIHDPEASPSTDDYCPGDTVAFLDYSEGDYGVFIHYIYVRSDYRGRGLARELVEYLYDHTTGAVDWGEVFEPAAGALWDEMRQAHPDRGNSGKNRYGTHRASMSSSAALACGAKLASDDETFEDRLGRCYELAGRMVMNDGGTLVHGSIQGAGNPRIGHAWVENDDGTITDPVMGETMPADAYTRFASAIPEHRYSQEEVLLNAGRTQHWGPWEATKYAMLHVADDDTDALWMVALKVPDKVGQAFLDAAAKANPDLELEPLGDLHVTLCVGKVDPNADPNAGLTALKAVVESVDWPVLNGGYSGYGVFVAGEQPVLVALPDIPNLPEWRQRLLTAIGAAGFEPLHNHGYTPHMTLAYSATVPVLPDLPAGVRSVDFEDLVVSYAHRLNTIQAHPVTAARTARVWTSPWGTQYHVPFTRDFTTSDIPILSGYFYEAEDGNLSNVLDGPFDTRAEAQAAVDAEWDGPVTVATGDEVAAARTKGAVLPLTWDAPMPVAATKLPTAVYEDPPPPALPVAYGDEDDSPKENLMDASEAMWTNLVHEADLKPYQRYDDDFIASLGIEAQLAYEAEGYVPDDLTAPPTAPAGGMGDGSMVPPAVPTAPDSATGLPADPNAGAGTGAGQTSVIPNPSTDDATADTGASPDTAQVPRAALRTASGVPEGLEWLAGSGRAAEDDMEALRRTATKVFSPAEQERIINEGMGTQAGNLDRLDISGTHYVEDEMIW